MYFIALVCPEEINQQVLKWKLWMKEKFGCEVALRSPAHITLVPPCWMKPELEDNLRNALSKFSTTQNRLAIYLTNFSNFKPRVIFVDLVQNAGLENLQNELFRFLLAEGSYPFRKDERPFHPHITIATRDLHKKSFHEAWEHFKEKKYEAQWPVQGVALLRHNKKNWDVIATSRFKKD
jgi:2'-5' RNA ligase